MSGCSRFCLKDVQNADVARVWTIFKEGVIHPGLSADAAYNICHAISQVTHHVAYGACENGHVSAVPTTGHVVNALQRCW